MRYLILLLVILLCFFGWGHNIYDLVQGDYQSADEMIVRAVGIFVAPISVFMGLFF